MININMPTPTSCAARNRMLGILGGMGPLAGAHFLARLTLLTPARKDQDHIATVLWSDPSIPDRTKALLQGGDDPLPSLAKGLRALECAGCGAIAIPCNTAHAWFDAMRCATPLPILDIVESAATDLVAQGLIATKVGLMGTLGTLAMGNYQKRLRFYGYDCLLPTDHDMMSRVMPAIDLVKANRIAEAYEPLQEVAVALANRGAQAVILGCTEIPIAIASGPSLPIPVVDSIDALARASIAWAHGSLRS